MNVNKCRQHILDKLKEYHSYEPVNECDAMRAPLNTSKQEDAHFDNWIKRHGLDILEENIVFALKTAWMKGRFRERILLHNNYELVPNQNLTKSIKSGFRCRTTGQTIELTKKQLGKFKAHVAKKYLEVLE